MKPLRWWVLVFGVVLGACGGGDSSTGSRTQPPPTLGVLIATPPMPWRQGVVEFSATCSGTGSLQYQWDLGDGTRRTTRVPYVGHVYLSGGQRDVSVTCIDGSAQQTSARLQVLVDDVDLSAVADRTCSSAQLGHGWCMQNPLPSGGGARDLALVDRATLWAVGSGGAIRKSTDAGRSWRVQASGTTAELRSIVARDTLVAWAAGSGGTVLKTIDGGRTWRQLSFPDKAARVHQIVVPSEQTAWAASSSGVYRTVDGGTSWQQLDARSVVSVTVVNERVVLAAPEVGRGLLRSEDAGLHWADGGTIDPEYTRLEWVRVTAVGGDVVWAAAAWGQVYRSVDGGKTWSRKRGTEDGDIIVSFVATDKDTAWILIPYGGPLLVTRDGGTTWKRSQFGSLWPWALVTESTDQAWVASPDDLFHTADGGVSWAPVGLRAKLSISGVASVDARVAWVFGDGSGVLKTDDGGISWFPQTMPTEGAVRDLAAVGLNEAWAICSCGAIWQTLDGGTSWSARSVATPPPLNALAGVSWRSAWVVGDGGAVLRTTNSGDTWLRRDIALGGHLLAVAAVNEDLAWVVPGGTGPQGQGVFKTTDGGLTWVRQGAGVFYLQKIVAVNASVLWALGHDAATSAATVYRTGDGGVTWVPVWAPAWDVMQASAIQALDGNRALVVGDAGAIYQTSDGGVTWVRQAEGLTGGFLRDAAWIDANTAWVIGSDGLILKTLTGGQ